MGYSAVVTESHVRTLESRKLRQEQKVLHWMDPNQPSSHTPLRANHSPSEAHRDSTALVNCFCVQVGPEPLEVLGPTARLRQVLLPHKGMHDNSHTVENLSLVRAHSQSIRDYRVCSQQPVPTNWQLQPPSS
jgi:hypothetical protein